MYCVYRLYTDYSIRYSTWLLKRYLLPKISFIINNYSCEHNVVAVIKTITRSCSYPRNIFGLLEKWMYTEFIWVAVTLINMFIAIVSLIWWVSIPENIWKTITSSLDSTEIQKSGWSIFNVPTGSSYQFWRHDIHVGDSKNIARQLEVCPLASVQPNVQWDHWFNYKISITRGVLLCATKTVTIHFSFFYHYVMIEHRKSFNFEVKSWQSNSDSKHECWKE